MRAVTGLARAAAFLSLGIAALASCGDDSDGGTASNAGGSGNTGGGGSSGTGGGGGDSSIDGQSCQPGSACGDGGICAGNVCCTVEKACGASCCGSSDVCSFGKCVTPGGSCTESSDCGPGQYCEYSLGTADDAGAPEAGADGGSCQGGVAPPQGKCLPKPPICPAGTDAGAGGQDCLPLCEVKPTAAAFSPVEKVAWGGTITGATDSDVMMTPIVIQLDDDDCNGKITERDIPEIVFTSFANGGYGTSGTLRAISLVGGQFKNKWTAPGIAASRQLAGGNVDGKPGNEVIACPGDGTAVRAFDAAGKMLWNTNVSLCFQPAHRRPRSVTATSRWWSRAGS
jgi:hypothetical protein